MHLHPTLINFIIFADEPVHEYNSGESNNNSDVSLKLFNIGNLSNKTIISIFHRIFPRICDSNKIMDLNVELTFFEFFEAFIVCAEESIHVADEERHLQEKFSSSYNADPLFHKPK